ncbi:MAG: hypothetical protein V1803_02000, partial [Candidatus Roizmanbacteria bacterium]
MRRIYPYVILTLLVLISTFILWSRFNLMTIYKHYDGPWYLVAAKTFYDPDKIRDLNLASALPEKYFAAHLPLYPLLIRIFKELINYGLRIKELGYLKSMVSVNILATVG